MSDVRHSAIRHLMKGIEDLLLAPQSERASAGAALKSAFEQCDNRELSEVEQAAKARWLAALQKMERGADSETTVREGFQQGV